MTSLAARRPENAAYVRHAALARQARAIFAGSPRSINEGDFETSLDLYREAEVLHRQAFLADESNIRPHVDFIASNFGVALVTGEIDAAQGLALLQDNLKLCLVLPRDVFETTLSNFSVAIVYRAAAIAAARLKRWGLARDYLSVRVPSRMVWSQGEPYFLARLEHASLLRETAAVEAGSGQPVLSGETLP